MTQHVGLLEDKLGLDASGVIVDYGRNVGRFRRGERVVVSIPGAYATRVCSHQDNVAKMPQGMPFTEAATLPSLMLAAHHILFNICRLRKEDSVLIDAETRECFFLIVTTVTFSRTLTQIAIVWLLTADLALLRCPQQRSVLHSHN